MVWPRCCRSDSNELRQVVEGCAHRLQVFSIMRNLVEAAHAHIQNIPKIKQW